MSRIEEYRGRINRDQEQHKVRIQELTEHLNSAIAENENMLNKHSEIKQMLISFVDKVKANSVLYGLVKKLDVWQDIEAIITDNEQEGE